MTVAKQCSAWSGDIINRRVAANKPLRLGVLPALERLRSDLEGTIYEAICMVPLDGGTSNNILDILEEWNSYLEDHVPYYQDRGPQP